MDEFGKSVKQNTYLNAQLTTEFSRLPTTEPSKNILLRSMKTSNATPCYEFMELDKHAQHHLEHNFFLP